MEQYPQIHSLGIVILARSTVFERSYVEQVASIRGLDEQVSILLRT